MGDVATSGDPTGGAHGAAGEVVPAAVALAAGSFGTVRIDLGLDRLEADARAGALLGLPPGAHPLPDVAAALHPSDRTRVRRAVRHAEADGTSLEIQFRVRAGSGYRWVGARGNVQSAPRGPGASDGAHAPRRGGELVAVLYEATGASFDRAATILEAMPTPFFAVDRQWRFSYVNSEAERVLGHSREQLLDGDIWELFPDAPGTSFETNYRHAMETGEEVRFDEYYPAPLDAWYEVRAWSTPEGLSVYFLDVTERKRHQLETERAARRALLAAQVTGELSHTLVAEEAVAALAPLLVPALADWCVVTLAEVDDRGRVGGLRDIGSWHADPALRPLVTEYATHRMSALRDQSFLLRSVRGDGVVTVPRDARAQIQGVLNPGRAHEVLEMLAPESAVVLPLMARGRTLGAITLFSGAQRPPMHDDDLAAVCDVAHRAALVLDNAYLYARQRHVAEELQRSFLAEPPPLRDVEVAARYVPASQAAQVGGDWYDAFPHPDGRTILVIGDVVGHDLQAAAAMGKVRSLLRGIAVTGASSPAQILSDVNAALVALERGLTATAVVVDVAPADGADRVRVRWCSAGHPPPMVLRGDGSVEVAGHGSLLLGIPEHAPRVMTQVELRPEDTLVLYTDGLVERRHGGGLRAGLARLRAELADVGGRTIEQLCDELLGRLLPDAPEDDVAVLAVRPRGVPAGVGAGRADAGARSGA